MSFLPPKFYKETNNHLVFKVINGKVNEGYCLLANDIFYKTRKLLDVKFQDVKKINIGYGKSLETLNKLENKTINKDIVKISKEIYEEINNTTERIVAGR